MADDVRSKRVHAYRDRRPDVSLLGLFSYDRFSAVLPEKGWIIPLDSSLSKLVPKMDEHIAQAKWTGDGNDRDLMQLLHGSCK